MMAVLKDSLHDPLHYNEEVDLAHHPNNPAVYPLQADTIGVFRAEPRADGLPAAPAAKRSMTS
jgi:hypothetical protein